MKMSRNTEVKESEIGILEQSIMINNFYTQTLLLSGSASSETITFLDRSNFTRQPDYNFMECVF